MRSNSDMKVGDNNTIFLILLCNFAKVELLSCDMNVLGKCFVIKTDHYFGTSLYNYRKQGIAHD